MYCSGLCSLAKPGSSNQNRLCSERRTVCWLPLPVAGTRVGMKCVSLQVGK